MTKILNSLLLTTLFLLLAACENGGVSLGLSSESKLSAISINRGTLTPSFSAEVSAYTASVDYTVTNFDLSFLTSSSKATCTVNGQAMSGSSTTVPLSVGENTVTVIVKAEDGLTRTYTLTMTRGAPSTDSNLQSLAISVGTLTPTFAPETTAYTASVLYTQSSLNLTATLSSATSTMTVNGQSATSGVPVILSLSVGANPIPVVVTAQDGSTKTYTVNITRAAASTDANLLSLSLSSGTLSPSFSASTITYTASVLYTTSSINITASQNSSDASFTINGQSATAGVAKAISLSVGANAIPIVVTAQDGSTKTYTVTVTRAAASSDANLLSLSISAGTLSPSFAAGTISYTASVLYAVSSLNITATPNSSYASFTINGLAATAGVAQSISLTVGAHAIPIVVTAQDGTTKTYTVTITRGAANTTNTLSGLTLSSGTLSPTFASGTTSYTMTISSVPSVFNVTATATNSLSTLQHRLNSGTNSDLTSGVASGDMTPTNGSNTLEIIVTAESGATRTYTVTITYATCGAGYYSDNVNGCSQVGLGYYSPANDNLRYSCSNKPSNSRYTSPTASNSNCPWSCNNGYLTTDGATCASYPNATTLSCNDDEVAVGIYGKDGSIIDRIGVRCATIDAAGNLGTRRNGPDYGGTGGSWFNSGGADDCPAGYAVYRVEGSLATYLGVPRTGTVAFLCKSVTDPTQSGVWRPSPSPNHYGNFTDRGPYTFECGVSPNNYGTYLNGIIVDNASGAAYAGDTLGITCR
ncbi:MAG: cadherin-like beta sandwich domain-containing protein [Pseudobdellovibrionaceae bacterium]